MYCKLDTLQTGSRDRLANTGVKIRIAKCTIFVTSILFSLILFRATYHKWTHRHRWFNILNFPIAEYKLFWRSFHARSRGPYYTHAPHLLLLGESLQGRNQPEHARKDAEVLSWVPASFTRRWRAVLPSPLPWNSFTHSLTICGWSTSLNSEEVNTPQIQKIRYCA